MEKNYSCRLTFGRGVTYRRLFASSAELIGDDLIIHLSAERTLVPKPLAQAAALAISQCENVSGWGSRVVMEFDSPDRLPDIDSQCFRDAVCAYLDVYGVENFNSLINREAFTEVSGNE